MFHCREFIHEFRGTKVPDVAQDNLKIIYLWDFQRREEMIKAEEEREEQLAKKLCLYCAHSSAIKIFIKLNGPG